MAATMNAAFVAAVRHLLAEGWNADDDMHSSNRLREIWWDTDRNRFQLIERNTYWSPRTLLDVYVMSVAEAVDHLVVAGVLPSTFASWAPPADPCPPCGHSIYGHNDQGCTDENCSCAVSGKYLAWMKNVLDKRREEAELAAVPSHREAGQQ